MADESELTAREREIILLESQSFTYQGIKADVVFDKWGLSMNEYFAHLVRLVDKEAAMAYDPILVKRLLVKRAKRTGTMDSWDTRHPNWRSDIHLTP